MISAVFASLDQFVSAIPRSLAQILVSATICNCNKESIGFRVYVYMVIDCVTERQNRRGWVSDDAVLG
jgi:hypothetical protein